MPPAPLVEMTSTSLAKHERFAYWAEVVTKKFVPLECDSPDRANFHGGIRHRQIGFAVSLGHGVKRGQRGGDITAPTFYVAKVVLRVGLRLGQVQVPVELPGQGDVGLGPA